jgi:hypothetical protein
MQIKNHWDSVAFAKYLDEVNSLLRHQFGMAVNPAIIKLAADYFLRGRSAAFCAFALTRHLHKPPTP